MNPFDTAIIELTIKGFTQRAIALELDRHPDTVVDRIDRLKRQYGAKSIPELVAILYERKIIVNWKVCQHIKSF